MEPTENRMPVTFEVSKSKNSKAYPLAAEYLREALSKTVKRQPIVERLGREAASKHGKHDKQASAQSKPKTKVSIAGVFKAKDKHSTREKYRRREPTPEPDIMDDIRDGFETMRSTILSESTETLASTHETFNKTMFKIHAADEKFMSNMNEHLTTMSEPLSEEKVEIERKTSDGRAKTEIVEIGARMTEFTKTVDAEERKLKDYWKQLEEMQDEYIQIGVEVFEEEKFGEYGKAMAAKLKERGFKKDMELLDGEWSAFVEGTEEDIGGMAKGVSKKVMAAEKEHDDALKKEQTRLMQDLMIG